MKVRELKKLLRDVDDDLEVVFNADSIMGGKYHALIGHGEVAKSDHRPAKKVFVLDTSYTKE